MASLKIDSVEFTQAIQFFRSQFPLCGRLTGLGFIPFERLLDLHMKERHSNVCVLPAADANGKAVAA